MSALDLLAPRRLWRLLSSDAMNISRDPILVIAAVMSLLPALLLHYGKSPMDASALAAFGIAEISRFFVPVALMIPATLVGWVTGFLLLEDRDEGTLLALDVTPVGNQARRRPELVLQAHQRLAHRRQHRQAGSAHPDLFLADQVGHVPAVQPDPAVAKLRPQAGSDGGQRGCVVEVGARSLGIQGHQPIERTAVQVVESETAGDPGGDSAFARGGRPVDGDHRGRTCSIRHWWTPFGRPGGWLIRRPRPAPACRRTLPSARSRGRRC